MPLSLVTAPAEEPITFAQVQSQLRVVVSDEQSWIEGVLIPASRDRAEKATRRALLPQTWDYLLDQCPPDEDYIEIPKPPLVSVTSFTVTQTDGSTRTLVQGTDYLVQAPAGPRCARGRVALPFAGVWPVTLKQMGAVRIRFQCGYADAAHVPPLLVSAMLMDVGTLYENREAVVLDARAVAVALPGGSAEIYRSFRSLPRQRRTLMEAY